MWIKIKRSIGKMMNRQMGAAWEHWLGVVAVKNGQQDAMAQAMHKLQNQKLHGRGFHSSTFHLNISTIVDYRRPLFGLT